MANIPHLLQHIMKSVTKRCSHMWFVAAGELIRAVEELRQGQGAEHSRRRELEGALRESAAIFKRELHDKNLELATLQQQLG